MVTVITKWTDRLFGLGQVRHRGDVNRRFANKPGLIGGNAEI